MGAQTAEVAGPDPDDQGPAGNPVLEERYVINRSAPLPAMSTPVGMAFKVDDIEGEEGALFAVLSSPDLPMRVQAFETLTNFRHSHVMRLVCAGEAIVSPGTPPVMAAVYEYPMGGSAMVGGELRTLPDHEVRRAIIVPICHALHALHDVHLYHRGIRPDNLFYADDARSHLIVGGFVSELPGQCQPVAFEPIERAFAPPPGRGAGDTAADMYAFGVTILAFLLGKYPCAGVSDEELLRARIERGSYAALCGKRRFSPDIEVLLSALLADNVVLRWGIAEVRLWLNGYAVPKKIVKSERAATPFLFEDRQYSSARGVADAFNRNWDAAASAIHSERLENWLIKNLNAPAVANAVAARRGEAAGSVHNKKIGTDEMIARTCIALDPGGPIRYKGTTVAFDGIGGLLASAMAERNDGLMQSIGAILARSLPNAWIGAESERRTALSHMIPDFMRFSRYMGSTVAGFGIERCLYELNPGIRCLSPAMKNRSGSSIRSLLEAIAASQGSSERSGERIDRHIAGFLGTALHPTFDSRVVDTRMPTDPKMRRTMIELVMLATAQRLSGVSAMPHLARSLHASLSHIVNSFHSRSIRKSVSSDLGHFVEKGDLAAIERLLIDMKVQRRDTDGYHHAMGQYRYAGAEIQRIRSDEGGRRETRAIVLGQRLAARLAYLALAMTIFAIAMGYSI